MQAVYGMSASVGECVCGYAWWDAVSVCDTVHWSTWSISAETPANRLTDTQAHIHADRHCFEHLLRFFHTKENVGHQLEQCCPYKRYTKRDGLYQ